MDCTDRPWPSMMLFLAHLTLSAGLGTLHFFWLLNVSVLLVVILCWMIVSWLYFIVFDSAIYNSALLYYNHHTSSSYETLRWMARNSTYISLICCFVFICRLRSPHVGNFRDWPVLTRIGRVRTLYNYTHPASPLRLLPSLRLVLRHLYLVLAYISYYGLQ